MKGASSRLRSFCALYALESGLKSRSDDRLSYLRFFWIFLSPYRKFHVERTYFNLKLCEGQFTLYSLYNTQYTVLYTLYSTLYSLYSNFRVDQRHAV